MIDPSSSEEESDDEQREPLAVAHPRAHLQHNEPGASPSLEIPHNPPSHHTRSFSPGVTPSTDTLSVGGGSGSLGSGSGTGNTSISGTPVRGTNLPRPTSPSPSLVSEKTVTDSALDPQARLSPSFPAQASNFKGNFNTGFIFCRVSFPYVCYYGLNQHTLF